MSEMLKMPTLVAVGRIHHKPGVKPVFRNGDQAEFMLSATAEKWSNGAISAYVGGCWRFVLPSTVEFVP